MVTDPFIDRVSELSDQTQKILDKIADELEVEGFQAQTNILRAFSRLHKRLVLDCLTTTQPIDIGNPSIHKINKMIDELNELSAEFLSLRIDGHNELSEAAELLKLIIDQSNR